MKLLVVARAELFGRLRSEPPQLIVAMAVIGTAAAAVAAVELVNLIAPPFPLDFRYTLSLLGQQMTWQRLVIENKAQAIYALLSLSIAGLAAMIAPLSSWSEANRGRASANERLLLLGLDPVAIAGGRLLASIGRTLLIVAAVAPVLSMAWLFGGVSLSAVALSAAGWVAVVAVAAAGAEIVSATFGGNLSALLYSYALLALFVFAAPVVVALVVASGGQPDLLPLIFFSPALAQLGAHNELMGALSRLLPSPLQGIAGYYEGDWHGIPPAHLFIAAGLVASLACAGVLTVVTALIIDPLHRARGFRQWPRGRRV